MGDTARPTVDFDHHTPAFAQQAAEGFATLRGRCPIGHTDAHGGFWVATTYEHARRVLTQDEDFTVEKSADGTRGGKLIPTAPHAPAILPGAVDGPEHDRLRKPLRALFSKRAVEARVGPVVRRLAGELLDGLADAEEFDFASQVSFRLTVGAISDFVGLEEVGDREAFILMLEDAFAIDPEAGGDRDALAAAAAPQFEAAADLVRATARARAADPRDDLISHMVDPGAGLSEDEVVSLALSMVLGGVRTTAASLDNAVVHLDRDRELRGRLAADPSLLPRAVDELTRLYAVTPLVARTAVTVQRFGDVTVRAGDRIAALMASANHDDARFPDADQVKLDRRDGLHLAFGAGTHYCLGIWLAHMELRIALEELLARMPDHAVVRERVRRYDLVGVNNGFAAVPVRPRG